VLHRDLIPDHSVLSPMAYLVEALDLLGRAHTLQSQIIERWYSDLPIREGHQSAISLMIVSGSMVGRCVAMRIS
jgi:hypothetical protein